MASTFNRPEPKEPRPTCTTSRSRSSTSKPPRPADCAITMWIELVPMSIAAIFTCVPSSSAPQLHRITGRQRDTEIIVERDRQQLEDRSHQGSHSGEPGIETHHPPGKQECDHEAGRAALDGLVEDARP